MENKQTDGFIYLWRQLLQSDIWKYDGNLLKLFVWCLLKATHQPIKSNNIVVERGQFFTGKYVMSTETGMKPSTVWGKLKKLKDLGIVDTQVTNNFTLITVCQYSTYQNKDLPQPVNSDTLYKDNNNYNNTTSVVGTTSGVVKTKHKPKTNTETRPVLDAYCNKYRDRFGHPYHISWAKDSTCIKRLLSGGFTASKLFELMDLFLNDKDSFLNNSGYTIPIFSSRINRYVTMNSSEKPAPDFKGANIVTNRMEAKPQDKVDHQNYLLDKMITKFGSKEKIPDDWWTSVFKNDKSNPHRKC